MEVDRLRDVHLPSPNPINNAVVDTPRLVGSFAALTFESYNNAFERSGHGNLGVSATRLDPELLSLRADNSCVAPRPTFRQALVFSCESDSGNPSGSCEVTIFSTKMVKSSKGCPSI